MKVTIYVEGGGDNEDSITRCRQGFHEYCAKVASNRKKPKIVPCGGRQRTFDKFRNAAETASEDDHCVLLVDSEGPVGSRNSVEHLATRDGWHVGQIEPNSVFLMVQAMEAWFLADREELANFYGDGFLAAGLPGSPTNIEAIAKGDLERALKHASKPTKTKGEYHKVKHGFALLGRIDPAKVERASRHAASFHQFLRGLELLQRLNP